MCVHGFIIFTAYLRLIIYKEEMSIRLYVWTHYGWLQSFSANFRKLKEIGVLQPKFQDYVFYCDCLHSCANKKAVKFNLFYTVLFFISLFFSLIKRPSTYTQPRRTKSKDYSPNIANIWNFGYNMIF